jgi:hypothetical protein
MKSGKSIIRFIPGQEIWGYVNGRDHLIVFRDLYENLPSGFSNFRFSYRNDLVWTVSLQFSVYEQMRILYHRIPNVPMIIDGGRL